MSKENTFRALQDLPLLMGWQCRLGLHKWTVWSTHMRSFDNATLVQYRNCIRCNTTQSIQNPR